MAWADVMTQELAQEALNGKGLPITVTSGRMPSANQTLLIALILFIIRYKSIIRVRYCNDIFANLKFL